jgi:outer membrane protein TolC
LAGCLQRALDKNADVAIARKRLEETAGAIIEARAEHLPNLTSAASYQVLEADYANLGGAASRRPELWSVAIRLTENIYCAGATAGRIEIARLNRSTRLLDYEATVDRVVMDTRIAFYDILQNQARVAVAREAVTFLENELSNQRRRLQLGLGDKFHVLRAEVSLALERTALVEAQTKLSNSHLRLGELLAVPATATNAAPFTIDGELTCAPQPLDLGTCLIRALELRPEVHGRANDVSAQRQQLIVDRSAMRPRVDLFVGYDVVNEPNRFASHSYYSGALGGVAVTWPWFDGFATKGRMQATRARVEAGELAKAAACRTVEAEVVRAFHDLEQAEQTVIAQRKNVTLAEESLQLAKTNVGLGGATQLELLQARLDLTRTQTSELSARFGYNAALARLQRAVSSKFTILTGPTP